MSLNKFSKAIGFERLFAGQALPLASRALVFLSVLVVAPTSKISRAIAALSVLGGACMKKNYIVVPALAFLVCLAPAAEAQVATVPTSVPGIATPIAPPAGFDPVMVSDALLALYAFPPGPDAVTQPEAYGSPTYCGAAPAQSPNFCQECIKTGGICSTLPNGTKICIHE